MRVALRSAFKEVLRQTAEFDGADPAPQANSDTQRLMKQLSELSQQRTNLAEKIVYQQRDGAKPHRSAISTRLSDCRLRWL